MKSILVVDDDETIGEIICEYLGEEGYDLTYESSSELALEKLTKQNFDLVITDLMMPGLNGLELTEHIFKNFPQTKVLACSGGGQSGKLVAGMALDQALQEGASNAIMKPFSAEELKIKVANLLRD